MHGPSDRTKRTRCRDTNSASARAEPTSSRSLVEATKGRPAGAKHIQRSARHPGPFPTARTARLGSGKRRRQRTRHTRRAFTCSVCFTANARTLGTRQLDAAQRVRATVTFRAGSAGAGTGVLQSATDAMATVLGGSSGSANTVTRESAVAATSDVVDFDTNRVSRTSSETRSLNTAYAPRIHV